MKKSTKMKLIKLITIIVIIILMTIVWKKSNVIREIVYLIFISFIISYTLRPLYFNLISIGINKKVCAVLLISIMILILFAAFAFLLPSVIHESMNFNSTVDKIQEFIDGVYNKIKIISNNRTMYVILDDINDKISKVLRDTLSKIFNSALNLGENLISLFVIPIICYYFLIDSEKIGNVLLTVFPVKLRVMIKKVTNDIDKVLGRYIVSQLMLCLLIGIATFFILVFLGVDYPVILSLLNAFFNIIPYFGPIFGAIPAIILALLKSPKIAVYTAIWLYMLQQVEGNIISPKVTGDSVSMHPLLVILLLIIGSKIGGFLGMVLAVPIGVVFMIIYEDLNYYIF